MAADIGGTNCRLALVTGPAQPSILERIDAPTPPQRQLVGLLTGVMRSAAAHGCVVRAAGLAGAGPLLAGQVRLTNAPLVLAPRRLAAVLRVPVVVRNDVEANAAGLAALAPSQVQALSRARPSGPLKALLGLGTGVGVAWLDVAGPHASEGGHGAAAARTTAQRTLLHAVAKRVGHAPVWEDVLSGPGVANVYLAKSKPSALRRQVLAGPAAQRPILISASREPAARAAMDAVVGFLAGKAQDVALTFLPYGGLYLCGRVTDALRPHFARARLLAQFTAHPRHAALLRRIPLFHVRTPDVGLLGAAVMAWRLVE